MSEDLVLPEVEGKLAMFKTSRSVSVEPVLVCDGDLSKRVMADGFSGRTISVSEMLGL